MPNAIIMEYASGLFRLEKVEQAHSIPVSRSADELIVLGSEDHLWYLQRTNDVPLSKIYLRDVKWARLGRPDNTCTQLLIFEDDKYHLVTTEIKRCPMNDNGDMGGFSLAIIPKKET